MATMDRNVQVEVARVLRIILTFELFLGGQARIISYITPSLHERAMAKAEGVRKYLSFIPIQNSREHTRFIGGLMCLAGALLSFRTTRLVGGLLSISLTLAGVYTQYRMQVPYWLPSTNTVLAGIIILNEVKTSASSAL